VAAWRAARASPTGRSFLEVVDLGLEGVLQGLPEEVAAGAQQESLAAIDDLPWGSGVSGGLQLMGSATARSAINRCKGVWTFRTI
jgi:hypothetical protein